MKKTDNRLRLFFMESLHDIYYAEKHLVDAFELMEDKAVTERLRHVLSMHREVTEGHVIRLEEVFRLLDEKPVTRRCEIIKEIIREAKEIISETESDSPVRDAGLILAAQKAAHYQIATYGTLVAFAQTLHLNHILTGLLYTTLQEEKRVDSVLTGIAKNFVNEQACHEEVA
jgi:ferritin-like metal-binding protein YciE